MTKRVLLVLACIMALSACGSDREERPSGAAPPADQACPGGAVEPIDVEEVIRVFRSQGISLFDDPLCARRTARRQAANLLLYGPNANVRKHDEIATREGDVTCLFDRAAHGPLGRVLETRTTGEVETTFVLANVTCIIYPARSSERAQIARVRASMQKLRKRD